MNKYRITLITTRARTEIIEAISENEAEDIMMFNCAETHYGDLISHEFQTEDTEDD